MTFRAFPDFAAGKMDATWPKHHIYNNKFYINIPAEALIVACIDDDTRMGWDRMDCSHCHAVTLKIT